MPTIRAATAAAALAFAMPLSPVFADGPPVQAGGGFPTGPHARSGTPNILVIMTDDVGFGASSTFGGAIPTPTLDALAAGGIRYGAFHTTAVCAPTRAALLTGRNPHRIGMGAVPEMATPQPGYNGVIPPSAATVARVLQLNGYATAMFGKHHATPVWEDVPGGPGTHKPNAMGFDYFYGFLGATTNSWYPALWENQNRVQPPANDPAYFLDRDLADHAVGWLRTQALQAPDKPVFLYYAPATLHAPVEAPADWIARFRGQFDGGWDVLRQQIFARQKRMGIIPAAADLAPMAPGTPRWDSLSPGQRRVAARYMEVYAAMLAYSDAQIGRLVEELKRSGRYDNTLIVYIQGDNGASVEGGSEGAFSYNNRLNNTPEALADTLARIDEIGGPTSMPAVPSGWTRATDAPFPWNKTIASHLGGTRNGMVLSWPGHMRAPGDIRYQFTHVVDLAPTLYEAAGIVPPANVDGTAQLGFDGTSFLYTLTAPKAPERHREQYFEVFGNMGLYRDGWLLSSTPLGNGESLFGKAEGPVTWELYDLTRDFSQAHDLAAREPARLKAMIARFDQLAAANKVTPVLRDMAARMTGVARPTVVTRPGLYTLFNGPTSYGNAAFPDVRGRSWSLAATITVPDGGGADGMIVGQGGRFAGWGLLVLDGRVTLLYRRSDLAASLSQAADKNRLAPGRHDLALAFAADQPRLGTGGTFTLAVDGRTAATLRLDHTVPMSWFEDAQVGRDYGSTLSDAYRAPFVFPGTIEAVRIDTRGPVPVGGH